MAEQCHLDNGRSQPHPVAATVDELEINDWIPVPTTKKKKHVRRDDASAVGDFSHPVFKRIAQANSAVNKMKKDEIRERLRQIGLFTGGSKDVLSKRLKTYYKQQKLSQDKIKADDERKYDYILVIDFEATCDSTNPESYMHEIIEFPVVVIDCEKKEVVDTFQRYVKPMLNPKLTQFCTELTGIQQDQVKSADTFEIVLNEMWTWVKSKEYNQRMAILTDGPWDMSRFMYLQCQISKILFPKWARRWINIRKAFSNFYDCKRQSLNLMLETLGLRFEGHPHSGLDDSKNIARVALRLLTDGCKLVINESLYPHQFEKNAANARKYRITADVESITRKQAEAFDSSDSSDETEDCDDLVSTIQKTSIT